MTAPRWLDRKPLLRRSPPFHANLLWSIGNSDQRSGEFRVFPNVAAGPANTAYETGRMYAPTGDGTEQTGIWAVPPANTTYTIGTSTPQTDWYFAQSVDGTWTVDFNLTTVPTSAATLTIALAGAAREANLAVAFNGHPVLNMGLGNDLHRRRHLERDDHGACGGRPRAGIFLRHRQTRERLRQGREALETRPPGVHRGGDTGRGPTTPARDGIRAHVHSLRNLALR